MLSVIIIEPENAGNTGAIARIMANFGFGKLVLIDPKCDITTDEARGRAMHGRHVLDDAVTGGMELLDSFDHLVATTAKLGTDYNIPRSPVKPAELGDLIAELSPDASVGLVIGRESHGMSNEEIERCDFVTAIPADASYPTMNISHAVAILLYEIFIRSNSAKTGDQIIPAGRQEKDAFFRELHSLLDTLEFSTEEKLATQKTVWRKLIGKSMLTKRELFALFGLLRKLKGQDDDSSDDDNRNSLN